MHGGVGHLLIADQSNGVQVRDLLLEELAKGLDSAGRMAADSLLTTARERLSAAFGVPSPPKPLSIPSLPPLL